MFREQLAMALDSLRANKFRSLLTMLGIIIGTGTLVAVLSLGNALQGQVFERFIDLGTRRVALEPGDPRANGAPDVPGYGLLALDDYERMMRLVVARPDLFRVAVPQMIVSLPVRAGTRAITATLVGTTGEFNQIQALPLAAGRWLSSDDSEQRALVAVVGNKAAERMFGTRAAPQAVVGSFIELNGSPLRIVGVLDSSSSIFSIDTQVFVPLSTVGLRVLNTRELPRRGVQLDTILLGLQSEQRVEEAEQVLRATLRQARSVPEDAPDDVTLTLPTEQLGILSSINGAITGFVALVAAISLLVGGIGIMNIMLVAVTERTREIGVRKALGATDRDILGQFVLEAVLVSVLGGVIGVSSAIGLVVLIGAVTGISAPIAWGAVGLALGFAAVVGVGFGSYPARRAALLLPVEALRYE